MSDDGKKILAAQCWKKGNEAVGKENWDYAIQMYSTSVKCVPDNLVYRQSVRGAEQKKYGMNGKGASMASMHLMSTRARTKTARMKKNWAELDAAAEEGLKINPWDAALNADVGDAAKNLNYLEVAIFAYEESLKVDGTNKGVLVSLADVYEAKGAFEKAAQVLDRLIKIEPHYEGARSRIMSLRTKTALEKGKYDEVGEKGLQAHQIQERINAGTSEGSVEADLQRAVRKEPSRDNYLKLGDYYKREGDLQQAHDNYQKALEITGGNLDIQEKVEDVELDILYKELDQAKAAANENAGDTEKRKRVGEMARELLDREIDVFTRRVERYPNDLQRKYELAQRHFRKQQFREAIPLYQQAVGDPRVEQEALVALAKCFMYDKKAPLARRQFEKAVPKVTYVEKPDLFKDLHYTFGRLLEDMGDAPAAEEHYQTVIEMDYNYKDANDRLTKLQGG